ncbi:MAG TPA: adenylate/guanylate cyclase domain-containing protein [Oculatellaceae cyanobacterium]|jgi:adenylate cyclase
MADLQLYLQIEGKIEKTITVNRKEFTLGRLAQCDLYLPFAGISRNHTRFSQTFDGGWLIEDLGSTNGTELNGKLIASPQLIKHGDVVKIGSVYLQIKLVNNLPVDETEKSQALTRKTTILRNAKDLQQQWISADTHGDKLRSQEKAIARLKDLVEIANNLNYAESIEAIFEQVQAVVFRYIKSIDRLALLIDVSGSGKLKLLNSATKNSQDITANGNWISRSICQKVFLNKVAIQTADAQTDQRFEGEHSILMKGIRSAMAVPIWDETQVVGVLYGDGHIYHGNPAKAGEDDLSFFSALANLVAASVQRWLLTRKLRTEETIRQRLERYHSPAVVQQMMRVGASDYGRIPPTEGDISILFADIVGFTALSERLTPGQIAELLNNFFEEMLQEVFSVGGTLDKFIGDCIMAFFGAPEPQIDHADRAVAAAQGMLKRLENLNARQGLQEPLQLRIAINSGKAVVGDVGSSQRFDYTVLGATINLASRMEAICTPGKCLISETTYSLLKSTTGFTDIGEHRFKGIERSIRVYQN